MRITDSADRKEIALLREALTIATTLLEDADLFLTDGDEATDFANDPIDAWASNNRNFRRIMLKLGIAPDPKLTFPLPTSDVLP